jgi:hypothetical protein
MRFFVCGNEQQHEIVAAPAQNASKATQPTEKGEQRVPYRLMIVPPQGEKPEGTRSYAVCVSEGHVVNKHHVGY